MADIAQLGYAVDSSQLSRGTAELNKHTAAAQRTDTATGKFDKKVQQLALSQKQLIAAQRQLPMQFTDIAVGLQSGQSPMQVLIQQGGQLKDIFGGLGPALRATGGYFMSLINPLTLAAGAIGVMAFAWSKMEERQNAIDRSLIRTGRFTEATAERLRELSREMDDIAGVTAGSASKAIAEVAATGRFTGEQLEIVARAAETWRAATGDAVEDVAKDFAKLKQDPVKAALELNRTYGFLTQSVLDQITALEEQGRETEATDLLVRTMADTLERRAPQMTEQVGSIASAFRGMGRAASESWDSIVEGMDGAFDKLIQNSIKFGTFSQKLVGLNLLALQAAGGKNSGKADFSNVVSGNDPIVDSDAVEAERKATEKWERLTLSNLSKEKRLEQEIAEIRRAGAASKKSEAEIEKAIADARARYAESQKKARTESDPTDALIKRLKDQIALNLEAAKSEDALTATERMLVQVRTELERIGAKGSTTNKALIADLMAQAKATDDAAKAAEKKRVADEALFRLQERIALAEANRRRGNEIDLLEMSGGGANATQMLQRQLEINRWYEDQVVELRRQAAREKRDVTAGEEQELKASLQRQLEEERRYQQRRLELMGDWRNGARGAFDDYIFAASDVASQTNQLFSNAFQGAEDALVEFVKTGKLNFSSLVDSIIADLARIAARQMISGLLQGLMGSMFAPQGTQNYNWASGSGFGNNFGNFDVGGYTGPGGRKQPAGIVHRGEVVWSQDDVARAGGVAAVEGMRRGYRGYALGGVVGMASSPAAGITKVEINNNGSPARGEARMEQDPDGLRKLVVDLWTDDFTSGGKSARAVKQRLDVKERV